MIKPQNELAITTAGKWRNAGGTYDLLDASKQQVDAITYSAARPGDRFVRVGLLWQAVPAAATAEETESPSIGEAPVVIIGRIQRPQGRIFDVITENGSMVHVVIHPSYTGQKPRLHTGDIVQLSGIWRRSKNGSYVSIRTGHILTRLSQQIHSPSPTVSPNQAQPSARVADITKTYTQSPSLSPTPLFMPGAPISVPISNSLWWWNACFSYGVCLLLPFPRRKTYNDIHGPGSFSTSND